MAPVSIGICTYTYVAEIVCKELLEALYIDIVYTYAYLYICICIDLQRDVCIYFEMDTDACMYRYICIHMFICMLFTCRFLCSASIVWVGLTA